MMRIAPIIALALLTRGLAAQDTTKAAAPAPAPAAAPTPAAVDVAEAVVAKAVVDRQPQDTGSTFTADVGQRRGAAGRWVAVAHVEQEDRATRLDRRVARGSARRSRDRTEANRFYGRTVTTLRRYDATLYVRLSVVATYDGYTPRPLAESRRLGLDPAPLPRQYGPPPLRGTTRRPGSPPPAARAPGSAPGHRNAPELHRRHRRGQPRGPLEPSPQGRVRRAAQPRPPSAPAREPRDACIARGCVGAARSGRGRRRGGARRLTGTETRARVVVVRRSRGDRVRARELSSAAGAAHDRAPGGSGDGRAPSRRAPAVPR